MMRRCLLMIFLVWVLVVPQTGATVLEARPESSSLHNMRKARRSASRLSLSNSEKSDGPLLSGLLVIPVDFSDARLPEGWEASTELSHRLHPPEGETLHHYFSVASGNNLDLRITLAPVVHLSGTRRDYSDRFLNGFTRTRELAREAITGIRDMGLVFRSLDMDGPDGIPGSGDDDGDVDGVLILHSGPGQENDPIDGWVQALQFFLEEPVVSEGITASFYAVASMSSGLGVWAHETGHLLGLEDRYDPVLHPLGGGDTQSRGGLGKFSLMASGAWGTGDGSGCALPDAYSAVLMGWQEPLILPGYAPNVQTLQAAVSGGTCARLWTEGGTGLEYFLLETRDPIAAAPFDAAIPGNQLLIYHIDENVPDGGWLDEEPGVYHLRAHLVEADAGQELRQGLDDGSPSDLFPGTTGNDFFGAGTEPSSAGYGGPSQIDISGITQISTGVEFLSSAANDGAVVFSSSFQEVSGGWQLMLAVTSVGTSLSNLVCTVEASGLSPNGSFDGGDSAVELCFSSDDMIHWTADQTPLWIPDTGELAGLQTEFRYVFQNPDTGWSQGPQLRTWLWDNANQTLDFANLWPGQWVIDHPGGNLATTWHRWEGAPFITASQTPVLACTGLAYSSADNWDSISYQNNAWTTLTSGPIGGTTAAVRVIHAAEIEFLGTGLTADGAVLNWIGPDGSSIPALPVQPWTAQVLQSLNHALAGRMTFGSSWLGSPPEELHWRDDVIPVPAGAGPWKLQFSFASNALWRFKGWFVAQVEPLAGLDEYSVFQATTAGSSNGTVSWKWPYLTGESQIFAVQSRDIGTGVWETVFEEMYGPVQSFGDAGLFNLSTSRLTSLLEGNGRTRHHLRIVGLIPAGKLASNDFALYGDGGHPENAIMAPPWPNPTIGSVKFDLNIPDGALGQLRIYNLAGRRVFASEVSAGSQFFLWNGQDNLGQRVGSGTYIIKLDGPGFTEINKVVILH